MRNVRILTLLAFALAFAVSAPAETRFKILGRKMATVYFDAGRAQGLQVGDRVQVLRGQTIVGEMAIVALDEKTAACRVLSQTRPIGMGDFVVPVDARRALAAARRAEGVTASGGPEAAPSLPEAKKPLETPTAGGGPGPTAPPSAPPEPSPTPLASPTEDVRQGGSAHIPSSASAEASSDESLRQAEGEILRRALDDEAPQDDGPAARSASAAAPPPTPAAALGSDVIPSPAAGTAGEESDAKKPSSRSLVARANDEAPRDDTAVVARANDEAPRDDTAVVARANDEAPRDDAAVVARANDEALRDDAAVVARTSDEAPRDDGGLSERRFAVKYRSASNAYLEAGRAEGLDVGDRLQVVDGTTTVAELEVVYVAELSASCKVLSETRPVREGDVAVGLAKAADTREANGGNAERAVSAAVAAATPQEPTPETTTVDPPSRTAWGRLRGAASIGYYRSWDRTESALDYQQRTARLNLGLYDIAGQPLSFTLRARSRQDVRARALSLRTPMDERTDRLYELALRYEPPSDRVAFELGRIGIYRFVGIGYLDGALVRFRPRPGLQLGIFGGRLAEIQSLGFSSPGGKYGAFVRLAPSGRYVRGGYDVLLAYSRENADGDISREYLSLESSFGNGSRWSLFQRAELDLNRGWRQEVTGKGHQFSNLSFSGNLRVSGSTWAFLSYDGRRNYRYYRNRIVPEEVFDDLLHQGLRAGVNIAKPGGFGASAGFGMSLKEPDPRHPELNLANAYSVNAGVRHSNLFSSGLSAGLNGSGFTNGYADGGLLSGHVGWYLGRGHMLDVSYGYSLYHVIQTEESRNTQWLRFLGRAQLTRWLYLLGDFEYAAGDDIEGPRVFLELGVLF